MSSFPRSGRARTATAAFAASAVALGGSYAMLGAGASSASSHREAPLIINDPLVDNTDVYAFVSPDDPETTTLISNWVPFQVPGQGPNFYPFAEDARYTIKIDNNGDAVPEITYRWTFTNLDERGTDTFLYNNGVVDSIDDETLLFRQTYTLERVDVEGNATPLIENAPVAPSFVGEASMPNYAGLRDEAISELDGGGMAFAGQADDPFFLDIRVFDLLYGGDLSERGDDILEGYNVNTLALQIPTSELVSDGDPVIGVWSTTERPGTRVSNPDGTQTFDGDFVQVSRLGMPLVNEVVVPAGLKDSFNALDPVDDATVDEVVARVNDPEVPRLIESIYGLEAPETPRDDIFAIFLTGVEGLNQPQGEVVPAEMLRLNTSIPPADEPSRLGVLAGDTQGFPNGRRLADDVVDIELQALMGAVRTGEIVEALAEGDKVDENDREFGDSFPYVALPHSVSDTSDSPDGGVDAGAGGTAAGGAAADGQQTAPDRRSVEASPAAAAQEPISVALPISAAVLGLGFAALGVVVLRRGRPIGGR